MEFFHQRGPQMGSVRRVVLGALVVGVLLIVGCGGADGGQEESDGPDGGQKSPA